MLDSSLKPAGMTVRQAHNRHARVLLAGIQKDQEARLSIVDKYNIS